jgi:glutamine-rich protein 2
LNNEIELIKNMIKECLRTVELSVEEQKKLKDALKLLNETKTDKDWTLFELDKKADKRDLDSKVNRKLFDETNDDLNKRVDHCHQSNIKLEDQCRNDFDQMTRDLADKLDRLELSSLKDYIEKQLKKLKKLRQQQQIVPTTNINSEDEAAGLRKQLLRFHCISCDRPIDVPNHTQPVPSLPAERGMRSIQTPRPYTTYELDQIRQFQRQQILQEQGIDLYASLRQAGGSHTITMPQKATKPIIKIPKQIDENTNLFDNNSSNQTVQVHK